jgi:D-alanyl-lipoteichoic acid acyltransferase DltB (MBOAT superfamily)
MTFSDNLFFGLFPFAALLYYLTPGPRAQAAFLVVISAIFMATFGYGGLWFAVAIVLVVWLGERLQAKLGLPSRWPLVATLVVALIIAKVGPKLVPVPSPIGASYYIFILIAILAVYPSRMSLWTTLRSVFFLPHILAGPISRPRSLLPQFTARKRLIIRNIFLGTQLFVLGYLKKVMIADPIAVSIAPVWHDPASFSSSAIAIATFGFYIQLYADFSGYTDMARGLARILGYRLPINFRGPYLAATPIEFWSRWHVSLTTWIRIHVYTPLSLFVWRRVRSKRWVPAATFAVVVLTLAIVGLWHELSWRFLAFGVLHGLLIGVWYIVLGRDERLQGASWWISWFLFQTILVLSLTLFRAPSWTSVGIMLKALFVPQDGLTMYEAVPGLVLVTIVTFVLQWLEYAAIRRRVARFLLGLRQAPAAFPAAAVVLGCMIFFKGLSLEGVWIAPSDPFFHSDQIQFIYARF